MPGPDLAGTRTDISCISNNKRKASDHSLNKRIYKDMNCKLNNKHKDIEDSEDKGRPHPGRRPAADPRALQPQRLQSGHPVVAAL